MNKKCYQCNSKLVLVNRVTERVNGSIFAQTTSIYKCTNISCQEKKDKEANKRMQIQKDKELANQKRINIKNSRNKAVAR